MKDMTAKNAIMAVTILPMEVWFGIRSSSRSLMMRRKLS